MVVTFILPLKFGPLHSQCCLSLCRVSLEAGMDKILQSVGGGRGGGSDVSVTNDGATILRAIHVDNAAAKV